MATKIHARGARRIAHKDSSQIDTPDERMERGFKAALEG